MALGADDPKSASKDAPDAPDGDLGPVDNSDIIQTVITDANGSQFVKLKPGMGMEEVELFPKDAWDLVMEWHGLVDGQYPIIRTAHNTNMDSYSLPNIQFEFHPPVLTIHRLWSAHSPIPIEQDFKQQNPPPPVVVHSSSYKYHDFLKKAKELVRVPLDRKVRLWKVIQTLPTDGTGAEHAGGLSTPPDSPGLRDETTGAWPHLLVEVSDFLKLQKEVERDLVDAPDTTCHAKYNGNRSLATVNLTVDTVLVIDESVDARDHVSTYRPSRSASKEKGPAVRGNSTSVTVKNTGSGRNSPAPGAVTRGRAGQHQRSGRTIGSVGLQNLGNTCYMNSALQCVRSVEELTKYFLTHEADKEINPDNPLSHNGEVAKAYGRLLDEIYRDPAPSSVAPRQFKSVIGRYAPAFSGYGQQDSQEFLGFLLDGLQEDLSRVKKKPYIPKPDSTDDMIGNPVAIREMADKVWDITKKRDDSVIADLFTGLYQSTLVCPVCDKVSITFDPFTNLTLPLPVASVWTNSRLRYFPLNDPPIELDVDLDKNSSIKTLKQFVSDRVGVPVERLFAAEVFRNKIFKLYEDLSTVNEEIHNNDVPAVFELEAVPTNVPFTKRERKQQKVRSLLDDSEPTPAVWEDPASERMLVPVVHRVFSENRHRKLAEADQIPAHVIVLTVEEARSEEVIRRKVLEKVATYSTWKGFHSDSDTSEENTDQELVNTSSDGDSNVVAKSVEGEDGLVDVKMGGGDSEAQAAHVSSAYPKLLKKFNSKRPTWIDAHEFLLPGLQNLFELSYFRGSTNIPCGWSEVTEDGQFPRLSSRLPKAPSDMEMTSPTDSWEGSEDSGDADAASLRSQPTAATRMVSESTGSDDEDIPAVKPVVTRSRPATRTVRAGKRSGPTKTYSRKDARKLAQASKPARQSQDSYYERSVESNEQEEGSVTGSGPLIRLGEGLVVDWSLDAYDALFAGTGPEDERGMPTWRSMEHVEDRSLVRSRKQREQQRKRGISLDDCLAEFEKEEILSEQDTWYCPRCKEHRRASKKFDLWKTPDILAVHLKRFSSAGYRREKLDLLVDFPVEGLDLTERVIDKGDGKKEIYDLIAVDDHWGGLGGGHYTAFAKNFIDGEWYEYNGKY
jgi:ubiquitin carboxyl-terminal hydrolase 4/11/15